MYSHKRSFFVISLLAAAVFAATAAQATPAEDYTRCTALVKSDPDQAARFAQRMLGNGENPSARHCLAMAAYALRDYSRAAGELDKLVQLLKTHDPVLRMKVLQQAGGVWESAGRPERALLRYGSAIVLAQEGKANDLLPLLQARARIYVQKKDYLKALQDMDNAVTLAPDNADVLLKRSAVLSALGQDDLAEEDTRRAKESKAAKPFHQ